MGNYLEYGAIGLCLALFILSYRSLSKEQEKDAPNESILKTIKLYMGLSLVLAVFFGVKEFMDKDGGAAAEITLESALVFLKKNKDETYTINSNPGDEEILDVVAIYKTSDSVPENSTIGQLSTTMNKDLSARKDIDNHWNIGIQKATLGHVDLKFSKGYIKRNESDSTAWFNVEQPYKIIGLNLWFKIDSIRYREPNRYEYFVTFGEGEDKSKIKYFPRQHNFYKSNNGIIPLETEFIPLLNDGWERDYYIQFGAGQPNTDEPKYRFVEFLNVLAIGVKPE
ncbi:MAG: hypothetical protein KDD10_05155 [Phaeodactylibacter sp.]|nr:hypothetical protein [Phaeodactylibacter sp.]